LPLCPFPKENAGTKTEIRRAVRNFFIACPSVGGVGFYSRRRMANLAWDSSSLNSFLQRDFDAVDRASFGCRAIGVMVLVAPGVEGDR